MSISSSNADQVLNYPVIPTASSVPVPKEATPNLFRQCLMDNLRDGVIFVDSKFRILAWSQTIEVMTGLSSSRVDGIELTPHLLGLTDQDGVAISDAANPLIEVMKTRKKTSCQYKLVGRSGRELKVEVTFAPVVDASGRAQGAVILVHDSSAHLDLQRQLRDLYEFSMLDPLTQVANRAEFEKVLEEFVRTSNVSDFQCSLIVCDIDFFKQINDNYNHHIGDQALVAFTELLKKFVRSQDVVARYGGEEFVILCANCDIDLAVERAEKIRVCLTKTPQEMLDGKCITASFGVSELQPGDGATDFFVRADSALLRAKELGRNRVVVAGRTEPGEVGEMKTAELTSLAGVSWRELNGKPLINEEYATSTPVAVLVEKLRCYIVESDTEITRIESDFASLIVEAEDPENFSRKGRFIVDIEFQEKLSEDNSHSSENRTTTFIRITVREGKRSWFATNVTQLAPQVVRDLRQYFMINDDASKLKATPTATKPGKR